MAVHLGKVDTEYKLERNQYKRNNATK
jgi:hypothetical protein